MIWLFLNFHFFRLLFKTRTSDLIKAFQDFSDLFNSLWNFCQTHKIFQIASDFFKTLLDGHFFILAKGLLRLFQTSFRLFRISDSFKTHSDTLKILRLLDASKVFLCSIRLFQILETLSDEFKTLPQRLRTFGFFQGLTETFGNFYTCSILSTRY